MCSLRHPRTPPNQNLFTLDGTDYNDALNNTPASAQGYMTGVETIKEFGETIVEKVTG